MQLTVCVFEYLSQKIMYIPEVNYYFCINREFNLNIGQYQLNDSEILTIARDNDPVEYEVFINTNIIERLRNIKSYKTTQLDNVYSHGQYTLCLHPSRKCNLQCKYCFRESVYLDNEQLSFQVAKDAIDFLIDKYAPCASKYIIDLSGSGEPLSNIDLIKQIVDYSKQKRNEARKSTFFKRKLKSCHSEQG